MAIGSKCFVEEIWIEEAYWRRSDALAERDEQEARYDVLRRGQTHCKVGRRPPKRSQDTAKSECSWTRLIAIFIEGPPMGHPGNITLPLGQPVNSFTYLFSSCPISVSCCQV